MRSCIYRKFSKFLPDISDYYLDKHGLNFAQCLEDAKTITDFDDLITGPVFGFKNGKDYYQ